MVTVPTPRRGEIWLVDFDPSVGAEIRKVRPAVVLSQDGLRHLAVRVVVPVTEWKAANAGRFWHVHLLRAHPTAFERIRELTPSRSNRCPSRDSVDAWVL